MDTRFIIVLSDIHIGTNKPTNWYQASVHSGYLEAVFSFLLEYSDQVRELILLGDLIDMWTYLPDQTPPTALQIFSEPANQAVFNLLRALVDKIDKVSVVRGNHDMTLTNADLQALKGPQSGRVPVLQPDLYQPLSNTQLLCTHGHDFSMMCAPFNNTENPIRPLPVGYYATRAGAYYANQQLLRTGKQNVAQLPDTGEPTGTNISMEDIIEIILESAIESVGYGIMSAIQKGTGLSWDTKINMPAGHSSRSLDEADEDFTDLFNSFATRTGPDGQVLGKAGAWEALIFPDVRNDLTSYATQLANAHNSKLIVFGHTHVPKEDEKLRILQSQGTASPTPFVYANSGFNCPSIPDIENTGKIPTFVSIGVVGATDSVQSVEHRGVFRQGDGSFMVGAGSLLGMLGFDGTDIRSSDQHIPLLGGQADYR